MAAPIKNVALLSPTGKVGPYLLKALQQEGFTVTAIVRKSSKGYIPPDVKTIKISDDYPEDEAVAAFRGQDAVVLSLSVFAQDKTLVLANASVKAGVRRIIGSFYGSNLEDRSQDYFPVNASNWKQLQHLRKLEEENKNTDWSWSGVANGIFTDIAFELEMFRIHPSTRKAELLNGGKHVFTSTTRTQAALATARILQNLEDTKNEMIYIASFEENLRTYLEAYRNVTAVQSWDVTSIDQQKLIADSERQIAAGDFSGLSGLALCVSTGAGHENYFSDFTTLYNTLLDLPEETMEDVLRQVIQTRRLSLFRRAVAWLVKLVRNAQYLLRS